MFSNRTLTRNVWFLDFFKILCGNTPKSQGFDSIGLLSTSYNPSIKVFELDYPDIVIKKTDIVNEIEKGKEFINNGQYNLIGIDLKLLF